MQDEHAVWLRPDPASITGRSIRVIGYSSSARDVLTVILVESDADPSEPADGEWWGANAWPARRRDRQLYAKEES